MRKKHTQQREAASKDGSRVLGRELEKAGLPAVVPQRKTGKALCQPKRNVANEMQKCAGCFEI
jgi:hypothetical protein